MSSCTFPDAQSKPPGAPAAGATSEALLALSASLSDAPESLVLSLTMKPPRRSFALLALCASLAPAGAAELLSMHELAI